MKQSSQGTIKRFRKYAMECKLSMWDADRVGNL